MRVLRLLVLRLAGGLLVAHAGGVMLLALILAVEAAEASPSELLALWRARVPGLWGLSAAVLSLLGSALALVRMRRDGTILALGTFGVGPLRGLLVAGWLGAVVGAGAATTMDRPAPGQVEWVRGGGGWYRDGVPVPDDPGGFVTHLDVSRRVSWESVATGTAAGAAGAALGLFAGPLATVGTAGLLLVGDAVARGLADRHALPDPSRFVPALCLVLGVVALVRLGPLFPRRWT